MRIFDDGEQLTAVKQALRDLKLDEKLYRPEAMRGAISKAKNELMRSLENEARIDASNMVRRIEEEASTTTFSSTALPGSSRWTLKFHCWE